MRKIVATALIIAVLFAGCVGEYHADDLTPEQVAQAYLMRFVRRYAVATDVELAVYKEAAGCLYEYDDLSWGNFAKVQAVMTISQEGILAAKEEGGLALALFLRASAMYDDVEKYIVLLPLFDYFYGQEDEQLSIILHELAHPLVVGTGLEDAFEEGLVDYLASKMASEMGRQYIPRYPNGWLAMEWLATVYGERALITSLSGGIGAMLPSEIGVELALTISAADMANDDDAKMSNVMLGILVDVAKANGKVKEVVPLLQHGVALLALFGIEIDAETMGRELQAGQIEPRFFIRIEGGGLIDGSPGI